MDINRLSLEHSTMEIIVVVIEISLRFMLGGPSEKKYFFSGSPPLNHPSGIQKLIVKSMVKRMYKVKIQDLHSSGT